MNLASLNKLPQLHTAVTENRKYGNPVVMGIQGRSQMEKRYGQDAEAMLSQPATKIFLKTSEPRAAKWISEAIGEIEVERLKESRSMGLLGSKKSFAMEIATKPLIMAFRNCGPTAAQRLYQDRESCRPGKVPAGKETEQADGVRGTGERTAATAQSGCRGDFGSRESHETKKPVQAVLPLEETPVVKREGFSWDESKGIE